MSDLRRRYAVLHTTERMIAWTFMAFPIGLGAVLLAGGDARVASPSFEALRATPGGVATWGWAWLTFGVVLVVADVWDKRRSVRHLVKMAGYSGIATVSFLFAFAWGMSAIWNPQAGLTGVPAYLGYAMLSASLASTNFVLWRLNIEEPNTW